MIGKFLLAGFVSMAVFVASFQTCNAQGRFGRIKGTVKDQGTMRPIPLATVVIEGTSMGAQCDPSGEFSISDIPSGVYRVCTQALVIKGRIDERYQYGPQCFDSIRITGGTAIVLNFTLEEGPVSYDNYIDEWPRHPPLILKKLDSLPPTPPRLDSSTAPVKVQLESPERRAHLGACGRMVGRVIDRATSAPVPWAVVRIYGSEIGVQADSLGQYVLERIPAGLQRFAVTARGYASLLHENIEVVRDSTIERDFTLTPEHK